MSLIDNHQEQSVTETSRLTVRIILRQFGERFFSLERGWLRTFRELTVQPGVMIGRYVSGHRKEYANPFAYLVACTAISIVIQSIFGFHEKVVENLQTGQVNSAIQADFIERFTTLVSQNVLYLSVGIMIPFALCLRLMHRRSGFNLAENLVFAVFVVAHMAVLGSLLIPVFTTIIPAGSMLQAALSISIVWGLHLTGVG